MKKLIAIVFGMVLCTGCENIYLRYAMKSAGENRKELKAVLKHYKRDDPDAQKLAAAKYLIENMPAHYSYRDTAAINSYYSKALSILGTGSGPDWQRDTLRQISDMEYPGLMSDVTSDIKVMTADYLIYSIDRAFEQWRTRPWSKHLAFKDFRDWILPYKVTELQSLDAWRDTLARHYSDSISKVPADDRRLNTIYRGIEIVRAELHSKQSEIGHRVIWEDRGSIPMRSADTWVRMTYGSCMDYVTMGTAVFRSMGFPAVIDEVPAWGRNSSGHSWYVFLDDRGREQKTVNSTIMGAGIQFYPYERIPKVWRHTYAINHDVVTYRNKAKYVYPFEICREDVTDNYNRTSKLCVMTDPQTKLKDKKYVYVAMAVNEMGPKWKVLDFGTMIGDYACFKKMGRNMLYIVLGYDGKELVPISKPVILHTDGTVEYLQTGKASGVLSMDLRRKYYESYNVADMRRRLIGGKVQCSDHPDFRGALTLYEITDTDIPYMIELNAPRSYRYWRYLSPDGSWGSISEIAFYDADGNRIDRRGIANPEAGQDAIERAYDGNLLSNFEINQPDGNWVGMDMGKRTDVRYVSISPRSDDNDVCPGSEYELFYFDGKSWISLGYRVADDNSLHYDEIPANTLLWLRDYTRGTDERPFVIRDDGEIEWL